MLEATVQSPLGATLPVTVIVNHLRSLIGIDDPADGARVRDKRKRQAEFLAAYIQSRQAANPAERIVSVGDYNAFQFSDGFVDVMGAIGGTPAPADQVVLPAGAAGVPNPPLTDLVTMLSPANRYSFVFGGNTQVLDHVLVNGRRARASAGSSTRGTTPTFRNRCAATTRGPSASPITTCPSRTSCSSARRS